MSLFSLEYLFLRSIYDALVEMTENDLRGKTSCVREIDENGSVG